MKRCNAPDSRCDARARAIPARRATSLGSWSGALAAAAVLVLGACDIPTEPPKFQTRFVVPGETTTLNVNQLLPSSVTAVGNTFQLTVAARAIPSRTLGEMCGAACADFPTVFVAPKPAFSDSIPVSVTLPADVASATLASGTITVTLTHSFDFDPLRPPGGANGSIVLRIRNGNTIVGSATINRPFPPNSTLTETVTLNPGTISGPLDVALLINSPAGDPAQPVTINKNASFAGTVTPGTIAVSNASVVVAGKQVSVEAVSIDLTGFEDFRERVKGGAIVVNITNPLAVGGTMTLTLTGGTAGPITKQINVGAGTTSQRIQFSEAELQSLLGREIRLTISGPLTGTASGGLVTVSPGQQISISTQLDFVFELGGGDNS